MRKYHIQARQEWKSFDYNQTVFCLKHLNAHEVQFIGKKQKFNFVVTYDLHCFAKNDQEYSINLMYSNGVEERQIDLERYHLSKYLRHIIENLDKQKLLYETKKRKYFTFEHVNDLSGKIEKCKVCLCIFKENRLLRIHVTSAFFDRSEKTVYQKGVSFFKIALDTFREPRNRGIPKEASRR